MNHQTSTLVVVQNQHMVRDMVTLRQLSTSWEEVGLRFAHEGFWRVWMETPVFHRLLDLREKGVITTAQRVGTTPYPDSSALLRRSFTLLACVPASKWQRFVKELSRC